MAGTALRDHDAVWGRFGSVGLDAGPIAVYRRMLHDPSLSIVDLAQTLELSEDDVREALDVLAAEALLDSSSTDAGSLRPVSPEVALRRLVGRAEEGLRRQQADIDALRQEVEVLIDEHRQDRERRLSQQIEILESGDAIVGAIEELHAATQHEIRSFVLGRPSEAASQEAQSRDEATVERGLQTRVIYLEGHVDKSFGERTRLLVERGTQIRVAPVLPLQMLVYDQMAAVTAIDPTNPRAGAMVVRAPGVIAAMIALFELQWAAARSPFDDEPVPDPQEPAGELSQIEAATLQLLARGMKDEAVARTLGVSVRTARRLIADLADRTNARSRFELAAHAAHRGWI